MKNNNTNINLISISKDEEGQRIDNFLFNIFKNLPKNIIYKFIRKGFIKINKKRVKPLYKIKSKDNIRIFLLHKLQNNTKKIKFISNNFNKFKNLNNYIIYEDKYLLILNKPSGMAVHGGSGLKFGIIERLRFLRSKEKYLELVHRLDKDTSGILLIAKKKSVLRFLHKEIILKKIKKKYLALVKGKINFSFKKIKNRLLKKKINNKKHFVEVNEHGKFSETIFIVKKIFSFSTLVKIKPITGRTHQIRVHSQYINHPIAFDKRYGDSKFDKKLSFCGINRLFLHSYYICFKHPINNSLLKIKAPLDDKLKNCLKLLKNN
ncbi:23S rRNA pseudouridine(955/2504/2580) synthase RluC [Sodalis-like secondary symbiont of Drepanosiphum platanoidis]|uniref:23S rRNA pseudouridine(955/2504/2580) synthase RluC n=1 Tax=Sodalis-like secondary symbiont of Drepanosiphum platanoidis TaxID=2994493 RepID=UPI0034643960